MRIEDGTHPSVGSRNVDTALLGRGQHGAEIEIVDMAGKRLRLSKHINQILTMLLKQRHFIGGIAFRQNHNIHLAVRRTVDHDITNRKHITLFGGVEHLVRLIKL